MPRVDQPQNAPVLVGDDGQRPGNGVAGSRHGPFHGDRVRARPAQDQRRQVADGEALHARPSAGEGADLVLVQRDVPLLGGCVRHQRGDDQHGAAFAQPAPESVQNAGAVVQEGHRQAEDHQVIALAAQRGEVVAFDVQAQPPHLRVGVVRSSSRERGVGQVHGVHLVAQRGEVDGHLARSAADVEGTAVLVCRRVLDDQLLLVVAEPPETSPPDVVLGPVGPGGVHRSLLVRERPGRWVGHGLIRPWRSSPSARWRLPRWG